MTEGLLGPLAGQNGSIATEGQVQDAVAGHRRRSATMPTPKLTLNAQVIRYGWRRVRQDFAGSTTQFRDP